MNAVARVPTLKPALAAAHERRAEARTKHKAAAAALARAREAAAECQREAERLASEEASWIARHSKRIAAWIEDGSHGNRPVAVADAKSLQTQLSSRANAAAAADALTRFEAAESEARKQLTAAEQAVATEADRQLDAEAEHLAARVEEHLAEAERIGKLLEHYVPDRLHIPLNQLNRTPELSPKVQATLERVRTLTQGNLSWLDIPLDQLKGLKPRSHADYLAKRRAELISGGVVEVQEQPVEKPPAAEQPRIAPAVELCGHVHPQAKHVKCTLPKGHPDMHTAEGTGVLWEVRQMTL